MNRLRASGLKTAGFTIIELIASLVLVAIISASVSSRWFAADAYKVNGAAAQLISVTRLAQKLALAKGNVTIHLTIAEMTNSWQYKILEDDAGVLSTLYVFNVDAKGTTFSITAGIGPSLLNLSTELDVEFDQLGSLVDVLVGGVQGTTSSGIDILLGGIGDQQLCISPLGFAHDGVCV